MYWTGNVKDTDDFGEKLGITFIDGKTREGPWAIMSEKSFSIHGRGLGIGLGQKFKRQPDGKWLKVEG